ncbi:TVP38/TMEM64 family protein [Desulfurivibrio dismutans]|uniref:TVP38/TMEM64 family protein n=1 Tax=Desulfurivibrio dismutans TaxID=1398908 RepID=UPI0023DAD842|nr:VTT domain-containing protein [Desulfurivibrio alkaliphilus]MDF1614194.1 VTT domain-containing protein [Desulfurivibrio alkaliphilus]
MQSKVLNTKEILAAVGVALLFVFSSWLVQNNLEAIARIIGDDGRGMAIYVLVSMVTIVLAPVATIPLIPIAASLWGGFITGLLNIFSWLVGSMIAFGIARVVGVRFVRKVVSLERLEKIERMIPEKGMFGAIVFLRMVIPVDLLSYALGLFSLVRAGLYFWATLIGIIPFAFILAYAGRIPFTYQFIALLVLVLLALPGLAIYHLIKRLRSRDHKATEPE